MDMYSGFAGLYDELMDDLDYPDRTQKYIRLIRQYGHPVREICDCATGTGKMAIGFAQSGYRVVAGDLSEEMLDIARRNIMKAGLMFPLFRQDMSSFRLPHAVDAITACCDGVNYLTDLPSVSAFFACAHKSLRPGGILAFDISSAYKLEHILGDRFYGEDRDDVTYLWQNSWDSASRLVTLCLTFFRLEKSGLYRRFDEQHVQRAHTQDEILTLLSENGFTDIRVTGDDAATLPAPDSERLYFTAVRA